MTRLRTILHGALLGLALAGPASSQNYGTTTVTGTVAVSGSVTVAQATASNLNATVVGTGTFAVQSTIAAVATSIAKAEDAAHADQDVGVPPLCVRDDTLNIRSGAENDYEPCHTDASGAIYVNATTLPNVTIQTFPDNEPFNQAQVGGTAVVAQRCMREEKTYVSINQTVGTQLATGTASERIYVCSINLVTATAQNIAMVSGTGSVCATSTSGLEGFGGATAATGWNFAANSGISYGAGGYAVGRTDTDADNVCLFQSGSGQVSGGFSYVSN